MEREFPDEIHRGEITHLSQGKKKTSGFPVLEKDGNFSWSESISDFPKDSMQPSYGYVFASEQNIRKVRDRLKEK